MRATRCPPKGLLKTYPGERFGPGARYGAQGKQWFHWKETENSNGDAETTMQ